MRHRAGVGLMLGRHRRRRANITVDLVNLVSGKIRKYKNLAKIIIIIAKLSSKLIILEF